MVNMTLVTTLQARISQVKVIECIGSVVDTVTESMNELNILKDMTATREKIEAFALKIDNLETLQETMDDLIQLQEIEPEDSAEVENIVRTALNTNNVMVADAVCQYLSLYLFTFLATTAKWRSYRYKCQYEQSCQSKTESRRFSQQKITSLNLF